MGRARAVEGTIRSHLDDPAEALTHAFDVFLKAAAENPRIRGVLSDDAAEGMLPLITTRGQPVVDGAVARLAQIMTSCWPSVQRADVALASEGLVRLAISYAMLPAEAAPKTASSVATLLGPFIEHAFAIA